MRDLVDGPLGRVRLHRRPRRLRLDPGGRARRADGDDRRQPRAGRDRLRLLQRAARRLLPADAARRRAAGTRATSTPATSSRAPTKAQELYKFLKEHRVTTADTYGALLEREVPALSDGPLYRLVHDDLSDFWHPSGSPSSPRTPPARPRLRRRGRPLQPARRDAARGRRARGVEARRRRPDRVRELHRPADRAPLPPERALPRRAPTVEPRAGAGAHRAPALGGAPEGRAAGGRPRRRRLRRARPPSARARWASTSCASVSAPTAATLGRGAARRLPARAPDPARRPAARARASPASVRRPRGSRAGRPRTAPS